MLLWNNNGQAKPKAKQTRPTSAALPKSSAHNKSTNASTPTPPPQLILKPWPEYQLMEEEDVMITIEHSPDPQYEMVSKPL